MAWKPTRESLEHLRHNTGTFWKKRLKELVDQNAHDLVQETYTVMPDAGLNKSTAVHGEQDTIAAALTTSNAAGNRSSFEKAEKHSDGERPSVVGNSADKQADQNTKRKRSEAAMENVEDFTKALPVSGSEEEKGEPAQAKRSKIVHTIGKLTRTTTSTKNKVVKTPKSTMSTPNLDVQERSITPKKAAPARPPRKKIDKVPVVLDSDEDLPSATDFVRDHSRQ